MKIKKIFKKMLALICSTSLLVGGFSGYATNSNAADTTSVPAELKDYTRITMENFGLTASTDEVGTLYENAAEGIYTGETLHKTYLDVDVNFNGCEDGSRYFQYLYEWDWTQFMRATHWGTGLSVYEGANSSNSLWITAAPKDAFFNLKLAVDMTENADDDTKLDIKMQVWVDNVLQGTLSFTASTGVLKQIYTSAGMTYRTPVIEETEEPDEPVDPNLPEELKDYTRITMDNFGLTASTDESGTPYSNATEGIYTGETLHKTYLDVDVNFNGCEDGSKYFQYLYVMDWSQFMRATHWGTGMSVYEGANSSNSLWITAAPKDAFFNLKLAVDMTANESDDTKLDIKMQVWVDNDLQGTLSFTASTEVLKQIYTSAGMTYRTPVIKEVEEPENPVVIGEPVYPNVPAQLVDYTKLDAESFGITEEKVHNGIYLWNTYTPSGVTTFDKKYMDVDVSFKGSTSINDAIRYMGGETYMINIAWEAFNIYDFQNGKYLYTAPLAELGINEGDYFNLKVATDISTNATDTSKSDVTFKVWINNEVVMPLTEVSTTDSVTSTISTDKLAQNMIVATSAEAIATIRITESLEDMVVHYSDISAYRAETGHTAPDAPAGYIFAGWYTDESCTSENTVETDVMGEAAYAKFVDARVLTVKAQITAGTTASSEKTSIRFVTTVNDKAYSKIGFKVNYTKAGIPVAKDYVDNIVYRNLTAMVGDEIWNYTPQGLICANATYFKAQIIQNITNDNFDTPFEVTPYWETLDGTVVFGTTVTKTVRQGIK